MGGILVIGVLSIGLTSLAGSHSTSAHAESTGVEGNTLKLSSGVAERPGSPALPNASRDDADAAVPAAPTPATQASCDDCGYYMQEGSFLDQACFSGVSGSCTDYAGFSSIYVDVQVETSPYPTGFELNGVSNQGDWFQSTVLENWCASGFVVANEIFNNAGTSVYGPCVSSDLTIRAGDTVQLGLYVSTSGSTSGDVCFTTADLTDPQPEYVNCQPQPDGGSAPASNYFAYGANGGFFTGPMTEIVDTLASSCESYTSMPTVNYQFVQGAYIVHFTPWSDEWYPPTDAVCYDSIGSGDWTMPAGNTAAQYVDASDASAYGPHWEAARNISSSSASTWWQFTTDAVLPSPVATPTALDVGQSVDVQFYEPALIEHIDTNPTYTDWDYTVPSSWTCSETDSDEMLACTGSTTPTGTYPIQFVIGETGGYSLSSPVLDFTVYAGPEIGSISALPASVDVGETTGLSVSVDLGSGGYSYTWNGLPSGCSSSSSSSLDCTPSDPGTFQVSVTATDSDGVSATSGSITLPVDPDPVISVPTPTPGSGGIDARQSVTLATTAAGGAGGFSYSWVGLPAGCSSSNRSVFTCVPTANGTFEVRAVATDANGYSVESSALVYTVYADPSVDSFSASPNSLLAGTSAQLTVEVEGGAPALVFSYSGLPSGCASSDSSTLSCSPSTAGTYHIIVTVTDANGMQTSSNLTLVVEPTFIGLPAFEGYAVVGGILVLTLVAVIAAALLARRRRKNDDPSIAQRVAEYSPTVRGSPVSDITIPAAAAWNSRTDGPTGVPSGTADNGSPDGEIAPGTRPLPYWNTPILDPPPSGCWSCKFENPPGSRYCGKCGLPLQPS